MFEQLLNSDFIEKTESAAKAYIKTKIAPYVYQLDKTIKEYCASNQIFISDIKKLLNDTEIDPFHIFYLYCENPYKHAIMLSNKIHENVGKWIRMETKITHTEFVIQYDFREIVRIYNLTGIAGKKHVAVEQYINPIQLDNLQYLPPEIELIDIYRRLYLPNNVEEWKDLLSDETNLYQMVNKRTIQQITQNPMSDIKSGGVNDSLCKQGICLHQKHVDIGFLRLMIFQHFIKDNFIVVGGWAKASIIYNTEYSDSEQSATLTHANVPQVQTRPQEPMTNSGIFNVREKLQIIASNANMDDLVDSLNMFLQKYTNFAISHHEYDMHIPKDFRIRRFTIRIHYPTSAGETKEKPLLDIFNAASYELIPYKEINLKTHNAKLANLPLKIGNIYVLLRFAMIDLLIIKMMGHRGKITSQIQARYSEDILDIIHLVKNTKYEWHKTAFGTDYYGVDINYNISKKIEDIKKENIHKPYIPELALKQNAYKIIY